MLIESEAWVTRVTSSCSESILEKSSFKFSAADIDGLRLSNGICMQGYSRSEGQLCGSHGKRRQIRSLAHPISDGLRSGVNEMGGG